MIGEIGKLMGVKVYESKYIPDGFAAWFSGTCKHCGQPFNMWQLCEKNFPNGHEQKFGIIKLDDVKKAQ